MTIFECIKSIEELKEKWPAGINFKTKMKFIGFYHDGLGGVPDVSISIEMLESDMWSISFQPMDKETIRMISGLFDSFGVKPSSDQVMEKGFDHPCRETCSGWRQGYERGVYESREKIKLLKRICNDFSKASKNKTTEILNKCWGKYFIDKKLEAVKPC